MCGICGIRGSYHTDVLKRMNASMIHRGPDSEGFYFDDECAMGVRRLKIIDLEGSDQPISNESNTLIVVCNGEIYNYHSLRVRMEERGHRFKTNGDVEVIVHLYEEYREDCLRHLRGMFALAIWDKRRKRLFLARDRLGVKPLYYAEMPGAFLFASEIKGIVASGLVPRILNDEAVIRYTAYPAVPAPMTIYTEVQSLLPGHFLMVDPAGVQIQEYWDVDFTAALNQPLDEETAAAEIRNELTDAVKIRLMSDVPLGAFLSGGIDSSSVVSIMGSLMDRPVRTFSIRFAGSGREFQWFDDASYATRISRLFGTEHTEEVVTGRDVRKSLVDAFWAMDQPSGDAIQYYMVSRSARKGGVTVALSGTGGDEVFAGYEWFRELRDIERIHRKHARILNKSGHLMLQILEILPRNYQTPAWFHKAETLLLGRERFVDRYLLNRRLYRNNDWKYLFSQDFLDRVSGLEMDRELRMELHAGRCETLDAVAQTSYLQLKTDMVNLLVRDQDVVSMAHGLEVRLPLIDHRLVELAARIPSDLKLHGDAEKYILRKALSKHLPPDITSRKKKGFIFPMGSWMRNELKDVVHNCLSNESTRRRGIFNPKTMERMKRDFFNGKQPFFKVWNQVAFELWCRINLDDDTGFQRPSGTIMDYLR
ncbi:asparagine synthase (glutamine-hydrolyzing) [bacterium]|nr:asparagine synthase (glutamine-hydrolyzing) [candidate division CSSED10-310 bacterium]